jgi:glycosyltransferase involved in cell wall biosynthesis
VAYEAGKAWLEEQVRSWQQVAGQRQEALAAYEAGKAGLEAEVRNWQQVAGQRQEALAAYEAGKAGLEEQVRNWQQVAGQRQETLAAYEAGKAGLEEQVRNWQQVAGQRQEALAAYEAGMARLEAEVRSRQQTSEVQRLRIAELESGKLALEGQLEDLARLEQELSRWQQIAGEAQESLARLEGRVNYLRAEMEYWHQTAEERDRWIAELEKAKTWLAQHGGNWEAAAEQRSERIAVLEETITRMRATRAWRTAEWSVGVLRRLSGICRGIMLVGSPRLASSNAKNFLLGLKLISGGGERRAIWGAHFDADYYKSAHPDVARSGIHPWLHYLLCGYFENRNPSGSFDSAYYRSRYSDVRDAGINPLLHYAVFGRQEQRSQAPPLTPAAAKLPSPVPLETRPHRALFAAETAPHLEDNEAPLVSVVIPCFNYGQYVEQAIHSVLSQTFTNLEIIVVEGGSTDGTTPEVLRDLERRGLPKTRFVYRTESHLAGDNRNFGIGLARGRYVCCLDADDLIKPTYLEIAVFLAEFCGYDMVYPSVSCFGESDFRWLLCDPTWPEIADGNQTSTVALLRRAAWEHAGGFRDWGKGERHVPEDWEFWVRVVGHGFRGKSIREPLMLYRAHDGGLWTTCGSTVEYHRQAIREANPQFFVDGFVPATASLERPAASWDNLIEPAGSHPPILIALPFITIGGAEKVFETLARSLIRRGYKVVVITTLVLAETIRDCTESFEAITPYLYPLPRVLQNQEDRWRDFLFYLLKRHQIGMILIAGCDFVYRLLPEITREFPQIAILDQLFNDEVHYHTNRRCAAYIDATFVPSPKLADKLISECGEQADKICVIPHGINIEEMAAPDAEFDSSRLPQHFRGKFLVSFFGRLSTEKAPADFVEIARRLRSYDEICFLMTGEGQERAAVLALIERYEMQDRIHAPGFVNNVRTLMALSDVVVVPSSLDGMPLVVFEAQACGKPVVASSVGSIPYVIADGETGLLCAPGDVNGFAERILKLWRSPELRRAIGDAARIWVRANHSAESMTSRYVEAFDRARSRGRRTAATNCTGE